MRTSKKNFLMTVALFCMIFSLQAQDVLLNGAFENWTDNLPDNWTLTESVSRTNPRGGIARSGYAAKHVGDGGTKDLGQLISGITPGATYTLTIWYTFTSNDETHASIWCYWKNDEANLSDNANELRGPNDGYLDYVDYYGAETFHDWKEYTVEVIAPASANSFYFEVQTHIDAEVYYDDFSFVLSETPAPITLTSFTATAINGSVELAWETATETNNARFVLYRNSEAIGSVEGAGTTSEPSSYSYVDAAVVPGVTYTYVLADVDYANVETKYEDEAVTVEVEGGALSVEDFVVGAAYPNPFNPSVAISYQLSANSLVKASVYNTNGTLVEELLNSDMSAGSHELVWNAANMPSGVYILKMLSGDLETSSGQVIVNTQKLVLMK